MVRSYLFLAALLSACASAGRAEVTLSVDILGPDDGETPPAGTLVLDISADLSVNDSWTATGLRLFAHNGAQIIYAHDPNTTDPILTNPGSANRFVTCLSRPRPRGGTARFENAAAAVAGDYCPTGPAPATATATELNAAYFAVPPQSSSSPSVNGAIARVALQANFCGAAPCCNARIFPPDQVPDGYLVFLECSCANGNSGMVAATFHVPATQGWSWVLAVRAGPACAFDIDGDNALDVNISDVQAFLPAFGSCAGDPEYISVADISADGCVDLADLSGLLLHFGEICCEN